MVNFNETVKVKLTSYTGSSLSFGHKSAMDQAGATYNAFTFVPTSTSYNTSTWSTVAHVVTGFNTLLNDLEKKGILIKG